MRYRKYYKQSQLAEIFGLSPDSFSNSSAKDRYINAVEQIIKDVEAVNKQKLKDLKETIEKHVKWWN